MVKLTMPSGSGPTSPTSTNGAAEQQITKNTNGNGVVNDTSTTAAITRSTSNDPTTSYVQRARVTRTAPPKPACNPLQFVQIKPCNLYQSAQEQLKRAEEVKKVKEIKKEEPEDWQSNLDNWKSCRRKRVEHIIDRVVETKKFELEEHDRARRKSKTFSEMLEERGTKGRKMSLAVYAEDDTNDLSDLGIGTSSASGKSSLSEDFDNQSVISDNQDIEKANSDVENQCIHENGNRDYVSSPGYDTSSSTAPASSPDPCEYTYEGAIQDYKTRISRTQNSEFNSMYSTTQSAASSSYSKDSTPERAMSIDMGNSSAIKLGSNLPSAKRYSLTKIENRLNNFEAKATNHSNDDKIENLLQKDLPKVDILKRRELFEKELSPSVNNNVYKEQNGGGGVDKFVNGLSQDFAKSISIKERKSHLEKLDEGEVETVVRKTNRISGDFGSIKDRLTDKPIIAVKPSVEKAAAVIDVPIGSLKDRLSSLQSVVASNDFDDVKQIDKLSKVSTPKIHVVEQITEEPVTVSNHNNLSINSDLVEPSDCDREDSGIHTADVSSVSQDIVAVDEPEVQPAEESQDDLTETDHDEPTQIEDIISHQQEPVETASEQDTSVIEALELAFEAIDTESHNEIIEKSTVVDAQIKLIKMEPPPQKKPAPVAPIYENISEIDDLYQEIDREEAEKMALQFKETSVAETLDEVEEEPHYQVPRKHQPPVTSFEPYYEVPKHQRPVPLYENIEIMYSSNNMKYPVITYSEDTTIAPVEAESNFKAPPIRRQSYLEPPKEKPPPPPVNDNSTDDENDNVGHTGDYDDLDKPQDPMKRMNSTKRIKKEIRNKRTSFLGIENGNDDSDIFLEYSVVPPPDMTAIIQEEQRLEKQMYIKAGLYDCSDTSESRDSGVSENHSRQGSEPLTTSSEEDFIAKKEKEIVEVLEQEERRRNNYENLSDYPKKWNYGDDESVNRIEEETRMQKLEDQIREQEEVLRVERELLQIEQEELKRQHENLMVRETMVRRDLSHGAKMLLSVNNQSLKDIVEPQQLINSSQNSSIDQINHYVNVPNNHQRQQQLHQVPSEYRQSMPNLQDISCQKRLPPVPPMKPMRSHLSQENMFNAAVHGPPAILQPKLDVIHSRNHSAPIKMSAQLQHSPQNTPEDEYVKLRNNSTQHTYGNMKRHTLHALSAAPRPKFQDGWVQNQRPTATEMDIQQRRKSDFGFRDQYLGSGKDRVSDAWLTNVQQQKRKSESHGTNYNKHWLIQEAEQRRIEQLQQQRSGRPVTTNNNAWNHHHIIQAPPNVKTTSAAIIQRKGNADNKPLPDAVIQTLTQRVQNSGLGERKKFDSHQQIMLNTSGSVTAAAIVPSAHQHNNQKEILSVSGKKKCSYCSEELGRGAAMIIESLRLFYHLNCFKCCVCRVQLGDGISGADVRVRNQKLHCHNCFSSDDGIKFSCV